jgi:hypothetical protein
LSQLAPRQDKHRVFNRGNIEKGGGKSVLGAAAPHLNNVGAGLTGAAVGRGRDISGRPICLPADRNDRRSAGVPKGEADGKKLLSNNPNPGCEPALTTTGLPGRQRRNERKASLNRTNVQDSQGIDQSGRMAAVGQHRGQACHRGNLHKYDKRIHHSPDHVEPNAGTRAQDDILSNGLPSSYKSNEWAPCRLGKQERNHYWNPQPSASVEGLGLVEQATRPKRVTRARDVMAPRNPAGLPLGTVMMVFEEYRPLRRAG